MILAADVGGTKTSLALFEIKNSALISVVQEQYFNQEFSSLSAVLSAFQEKYDREEIDAVSFGVAGPVMDGHCHITNLSWDISRDALKDHWHTDQVYLLNDLEATAYGMLYVEEDQFEDLNPEGEVMDGNRAVIAAGTGLGEAMLFHDGENYHPVASEGGHSDFAPLTEQQDALLQWLRQRYPEHVSYERILSGAGIALLYDFLLETGIHQEPRGIFRGAKGKDRSAIITDHALKRQDPLCMEVLSLFSEIYGAEAGNLALKTLSRGGVCIGGGIAPKIVSEMTKEHFMKGFLSKGRFNGILQKMQVRISLHPETAVLGAAYYAFDRHWDSHTSRASLLSSLSNSH